MITTWTPLSQVNKDLIPDYYLAWLEKPYILSRAIKAISNSFAIHVISQNPGVIHHDEAGLLRCEGVDTGLIRQTYLMGDDKPYVFARVCVPPQTLAKNEETFRNLGNRPIGETLLYNASTVNRGEFQVREFAANDPIFKDATMHIADGNDVIWGRRSLFGMDGNLLLVNEFFLPSIPSYANVYKNQLSKLAMLANQHKIERMRNWGA